MREICGLHAPVQGATPAFQQSCLLLGATCVLWTAAEGPQDTRDGITNLVRLPTPQQGETGDAYIARTRPIIAPWYGSGIPAIFIPGNEPDIRDEHGGDVPVAYGRDKWEATIAPIVAALRHTWAAIQLGSVPYSVADTNWLRGTYLALFDHLCLHAYWPADQPQLMSDPAWGASWAFAVDYPMPVWITEANSNPVTPAQIGTWLAGLSERIRGVCFFLADDVGGWPQYSITPERATAIRAAYREAIQTGGASGPPAPPVAPAPLPTPPQTPPSTPPSPPPGVPVPSPAPAPDTNGLFQRSDYGYQPLSRPQFDAIIQASLWPGARSSPMDTDVNFGALLREARNRDVDLRLFLGFTWEEDHDETDPGGADLYTVNNPAGIKWRGQAGAYDSGIAYPANEGVGTYAGFADLGTFFDGWVDVMTNNLIGPYFESGDLYSAARKYVNWNNPTAGRGRIDKWMEYRTLYPPEESAASDRSGVTPEMIIAKVRTYIGQPSSDGIDGQPPPNTFHPWSFWCEALAEAIPRSFGLPIPRIDSAADHGRILLSQGRLAQRHPRHGEWVFLDERFEPNGGHVFFWDATVQMALGTLTDGTGVGYHRGWDEHTVGFLGCCLPDGVGEGEDLMRHDGKLDAGMFKWMWQFRTDVETGQPIAVNEQSGIYQAAYADALAGKPWGVVQTNEHDLGDRILQMFSSGVATYLKATNTVYFN